MAPVPVTYVVKDHAGASEEKRLISGLRQLAFGRVYHVNQEQIKKQWEGRMEFDLRELKGIENYYKRKGDEINRAEVHQQYIDLEAQYKELKRRK